MHRHLLTVLTLLITLTFAAQPVSASVTTGTTSAPVAPSAKRYYELWNKMTLRNILLQRVSTTSNPSAAPTNKPSTTPTPTTKVFSTYSNTPTPTMRQVTPTPTRVPTKVPTKALTSAPTAVTTNEVTTYIMKEINDYRASQGLSSVKTSTETCNFAKIRAQEISTSFNHDGFNNRKNSHTLPYASWTAITENIAMTSDYKQVATMWKNSAGHAANMRANTPYVCVMQNGNYFAYEGMKP